MSNPDNDIDSLDDLEMDLEVDSAVEAAKPVVTVDMAVEYVDPRQLKPNPWNPNNVDPINQDKLQNSIKLTGIKRPIVVRQLEDGSYQIIGGQHRTAAAITLGLTQVPIINRGPISDSEAKRETLIDNFRYGTDNIDRMAQLLNDPDIGSAEELVASMPIDEEELAGYFEHLGSEDLGAELDEALGEAPPPSALEDEDEDSTIDLGAGKPVRTHTIIRFRVSLEDAERIAALIKQTKIDERLIDSDDLTNDGDALVHLVKDGFLS